MLQAEAELLSAIVMFFTRLGITSKDVGIKVSNRKVLRSSTLMCYCFVISLSPSLVDLFRVLLQV